MKKKIPIEIVSPFLANLFSWTMRVKAFALWPFVVSRAPMDFRTRLHETIHIRQQQECFILPFYLIYLYDWIRGLIKYKDSRTAYRSIRFEQEAFHKESILDYLSLRRRFAWKQYKI